MNALRSLKRSLLTVSNSVGLFGLVANSTWRAHQLLILCYHGISIDDEHEWAPGLYMRPDAFVSRLELLRRRNCSVLPLGEAVQRLYDGTLPARSVAITFDDGSFDFHCRAWPLLKQYGYAATVYLTTYYCERNLPVFPLAISYLLWKGRGTRVSMPSSGRNVILIDTYSADGRRRAHESLVQYAQDEGMSAIEKDALAERLAGLLALDYGAMKRKRLMHIMKPDEVSEIAAAGVDVQLHTHRHRSPPQREAYRTEVAENRDRIASLTGQTPRHFCYPSGVILPLFPQWLGEEGVISATSCEPGFATTRSDRFQLPRLLDHSDVSLLEFDAWLTGMGALLPHRRVGFQPVDSQGRPALRRGAHDASPTPVRDDSTPASVGNSMENSSR